jgi:hypothetical protein
LVTFIHTLYQPFLCYIFKTSRVLAKTQLSVSGDLHGQLHRSVFSPVSSATLLAYSAIETGRCESYELAVGKLRIRLNDCVQLQPLPLSLLPEHAPPSHLNVLTLFDKENKFVSLRFVEEKDFVYWQQLLGSALAQLLCDSAIHSLPTLCTQRIRQVLLACALLTTEESPLLRRARSFYLARKRLTVLLQTMQLTPQNASRAELAALLQLGESNDLLGRDPDMMLLRQLSQCRNGDELSAYLSRHPPLPLVLEQGGLVEATLLEAPVAAANIALAPEPSVTVRLNGKLNAQIRRLASSPAVDNPNQYSGLSVGNDKDKAKVKTVTLRRTAKVEEENTVSSSSSGCGMQMGLQRINISPASSSSLEDLSHSSCGTPRRAFSPRASCSNIFQPATEDAGTGVRQGRASRSGKGGTAREEEARKSSSHAGSAPEELPGLKTMGSSPELTKVAPALSSSSTPVQVQPRTGAWRGLLLPGSLLLALAMLATHTRFQPRRQPVLVLGPKMTLPCLGVKSTSLDPAGTMPTVVWDSERIASSLVDQELPLDAAAAGANAETDGVALQPIPPHVRVRALLPRQRLQWLLRLLAAPVHALLQAAQVVAAAPSSWLAKLWGWS